MKTSTVSEAPRSERSTFPKHCHHSRLQTHAQQSQKCSRTTEWLQTSNGTAWQNRERKRPRHRREERGGMESSFFPQKHFEEKQVESWVTQKQTQEDTRRGDTLHTHTDCTLNVDKAETP